MSIKFTSGAPTDTHDKVHSWVNELQSQSQEANVFPVIGDGYEVKYVSAEDIASGHLLDAAHTSRWRHLVTHGGRPHGELELDDMHLPVALHQGPGKDGLVAALKRAEQLQGDFEVAVLTSTPLRFIALWLHNDGSDLIMPYAPDATPLENYVAVPAGEALGVLQSMAADVLKMSAESDQSAG
ncbi:MAG: hypothetical protein WA822_09320 [Albidovulum sp.]